MKTHRVWLQYKCRRCAEVHNIIDWEETSATMARSRAMFFMEGQLDKMPTTSMPCKDGGQGICDFIGVSPPEPIPPP